MRSQGSLLLNAAPRGRSRPRVFYSFEDIVALRMFVALRQETSLQRIRKAVSWLQAQHPDTHLSEFAELVLRSTKPADAA